MPRKPLPAGSLDGPYAAQAAAKMEEASHLPAGKERDKLVREARQIQIASRLDQWLASPGLRPPT